MLTSLVLLALALPTAQAPARPPRDCRIEVSSSALELIGTSNGSQTRWPLAEADVPSALGGSAPRLTTAPVPGTNVVLAAFNETWSGPAPLGIGKLYALTCGDEPTIELAVSAPGVDFGRIVIARDGRWIVGGWGGLRVLDPKTRRVTPLTAPPPIDDPTCWTQRDGKTAAVADVPLVDDDGVATTNPDGDEEIPFVRLAACGYEAELTSTRHALLIDRGVVRRIVSVAAVLMTDHELVVGDGHGPCQAQTAGTIWTRAASAWAPTRVTDRGRAGIARIAKLGDQWLALTAVCDNGGNKVGGDLYASADFVRWERVPALPEGTNPGVAGGGIGELIVADGRAYVAAGAPASGAARQSWWSSADAVDWKPAAARNVPKPSQALAKTLGVATILGTSQALAWTDDGLFEKRDGAWLRVFP